MATYLAEVKHAINTLLPALWAEHDEVEVLSMRRDSLREQAESEYRSVALIGEEAEDPDDVMMATGRYWDNYFGPDKQQHELREQVSAMEVQIEVHSFSVAALAGALLQIAKQGLSMVHGQKPSGRGRALGRQHLSSVIWEARNQAIHWEEGRLRRTVESCFEGLDSEFGPQFGDYLTRSLAFDVIDLLGWRSFEDVENDLLSLQ